MAFRRHTLLPLDDCLYALQATIPHPTRSSLHRLFKRHDSSRLPAIETEKSSKKAFRKYPIGYFHIDIAEVRTEQGKLQMLVAIARAYASSDQRNAAIGPWFDDYNLSRPHSSIGGLTPWVRVNNLLGNDS